MDGYGVEAEVEVAVDKVDELVRVVDVVERTVLVVFVVVVEISVDDEVCELTLDEVDVVVCVVVAVLKEETDVVRVSETTEVVEDAG